MALVEGHIQIFQDPRIKVGGMSLRQAAPVMKMNADASERDADRFCRSEGQKRSIDELLY